VNVTPLRVGPPVLLPHEKALARRCLVYGITPEQYKKLVLLQRGLCAICQRPPRKKSLNIDHNHYNQNVRGLLCIPCNRTLNKRLGAPILRAMADYVERDFDARKL
jgi:hypothetical protein